MDHSFASVELDPLSLEMTGTLADGWTLGRRAKVLDEKNILVLS